MYELIEKKSRFIGIAYNVDTKSQIDEILLSIKKEHKKCRHICFAYKISAPEYLIKCSDDGEPNGTAGRPILNIIEKKNLDHILVVVIRYFGGIKLGAGGLFRAYTNCASGAVEEFINNGTYGY